MELREYLSVLARRKQIVIAVFVGAVGIALAVTLFQPPTWTGKATLRVEPSATLVGGSVQADDVDYLDRLVNTYARLATSEEMRARVARELSLPSPPGIDFKQIPNTNLVDLRVMTSEQRTAALAADRVASLLISQVETMVAADERAGEQSFQRRTRRLEEEKARVQADLEQEVQSSSSTSERALLLREQISGLTERLAALREDHERFQSTRDANSRAVSMVATPAVPRAPGNRNVKLALALALMLALVVGPGLAFLAENLTKRFRTPDEIEALVDAPVLAAVPMVMGTSGRVLFDGGSPAEEAFGRLRTTLLLRSRSHDERGDLREPRTILVTSAYAAEGKSTVVANLGQSLARSGGSTLLIDADLRRPVLHEFFHVDRDLGLGQLLDTRTGRQPLPWRDFVVPTGIRGLDLLPAGGGVHDSPTLLGLRSTSTLLAEIAEGYDHVLIDSPAVLAATDALVITRNVDGVLLVAGSNVERDMLGHAHRELTRVGAPVIGVVLNGVEEGGIYYPYFEYGPEQRASPTR